jgi:DNA-binding SARP family transcriptional activator
LRRSRLDVASAGVAVVILIIVPFLLSLTTGWPLPSSWTSRAVLSSRGLLDLATIWAWVAWVACCIPLCRRVVERVRDRDINSEFDGRIDWLAARIATVILACIPATAVSIPSVVAVTTRHQGAAESSVRHLHRAALSLGGTLSVPGSQSTDETFPGSYSGQDASATLHLKLSPDWSDSTGQDSESSPAGDALETGRGGSRNVHLAYFEFCGSDIPNSLTCSEPRGRNFISKGVHPPTTALVDLPMLFSDFATIGICGLGVSAFGRRLRSKRNSCSTKLRPKAKSQTSQHPTEPASSHEGDPHFDGIRLDWLCHLLASLESSGNLRDGLRIGLVRSGLDVVEVFLSQEVSWAPEGWQLGDQATSWIARIDGIAPLVPTTDPKDCPIVLPVGMNSSGSWAVSLSPRSSLAVVGQKAELLIASFASLARQEQWSERVNVRSTANGIEVMWLNGTTDGTTEKRARVTTRPNEEVDLTIVVDSQGLTLHPQGLSLRPDSLIDVGSASRRNADQDSPGDEPVRVEVTSHGAVGSSAGELEVKLLTVLPWIDGLQGVLPTKRARRATELVAYLALHHPDPISSDRLRTRVLGTPDFDAAAKTLFNTVGAARRALGSDSKGQLYLPNASRYGHYKLSQSVTVDVTRAAQFVTAARDAASVDESIALYRGAFDLVKGEPLAGVLSGYSWWSSEGHEARLNATIVDAACRAVHLAIGAELLDLAAWVLDRARLVDPYSELLSRAAMATAAASGDRTRLRREWDECRRRVSEFDPGGHPSQETERLFDHLSRRGTTTSYLHQASLAAMDEAP